MKSIKKIMLVALTAILSISYTSAQVGIQAGYSASINTDNEIALSGFHVGPVYNLSIQGPISLQYGLLYNYMFKETTGTILGVTGSSKTTAHKLDIPVRVAASFPFGNGLSAFVFGGPNFNFGLSQVTSGTTDFWGLGTVYTEGENIYKLEMSDGKKRFSPFDLQLGAGAGIQFNQLSLRFSYDWGMLDRDNSDNRVWKNNDMKIGIAYSF
ncbi:MAG: PorT family protein [Porphyromonadaceae bacterium]|nr:PorT family protein [Porphyromonadaceae bacterium]